MDPKKELFSFAEEFKNFALKGNVIDLAVGVIIGGAFGKHRRVAGQEHHHADHQPSLFRLNGDIRVGNVGPVLIGHFLGDVLNFLSGLRPLPLHREIPGLDHADEEGGPAPPALTKDQELLVEIRDLLKSQQK